MTRQLRHPLHNSITMLMKLDDLQTVEKLDRLKVLLADENFRMFCLDHYQAQIAEAVDRIRRAPEDKLAVEREKLLVWEGEAARLITLLHTLEGLTHSKGDKGKDQL